MYNGTSMLLKIELQDEWVIVGGMITTKFEIESDLVEANIVSSSGWRVLLEGGLKYINICLSGYYTDNLAEAEIFKLAFSGNLAKYRLEFSNKKNLEGMFKIVSYNRFGDMDKEELYSITLASSSLISCYNN